MAELGALSSYALSVQQMQMSLIKNSVEMQQEVAYRRSDAAES